MIEIIKVQLIEDGYLVNDKTFIPNDAKNRHYKQIEEWIANGGEVIPLPPNDYSILNENNQWIDDVEKLAEIQRVEGIETAIETAGLKNVTIEQAETAIDGIIDQATTIDELKAQVKKVLKKMVPYILA